jgi:hypothetical protein
MENLIHWNARVYFINTYLLVWSSNRIWRAVIPVAVIWNHKDGEKN